MKLPDGIPSVGNHLIYYRVKGCLLYVFRYQTNERLQPVSAIYWGVVTAGYLAYSFVTMDWQRSWIVWPVAGVLYGVIFAVVSAVRKKER